MSPRQMRVFLGALLSTTLVLGLSAAAATEIFTDTAPPQDRVEHAPPPRDGYRWAAGHWEWNGRSYVWISGTWIAERRGAHWVVDRWEQVDGRWHYLAGHWEH